MTGPNAGDESVAAHGARWITLAFVTVGLSNYGYALLLTRLLNVAQYSKFAAGQGLILWASTVAIVCVPWVLAQALARSRTDTEKSSALRFAKLVSVGSGIAAAIVVGAIAARFAGTATALALAFSTFVVFLGTTTTGWLQGREQMRELSVLYVAENVVKNGTGVALVTLVNFGNTGALAAYGIGALVMLLRWPRTPRVAGGRWLSVAGNRRLWGRAAAIAGTQGLVSLFVAVDVILVALLPGERALAASYQASATLSRIPLFVASAVATAFFPSLSRCPTEGVLVARAMRMYAAVALPLVTILMTMPPTLLGTLFPAQYSAVATLLKYTAITGLGVGGISLITTFFQAADDYSFVRWLTLGLIGYIGALLVGWCVDGINGVALGGSLGSTAALILIGFRLVRRRGHSVLFRIPLGEAMLSGAVLVMLRSHLVLWLAVSGLVGLRAGARYLRPGARHARGPRWLAATPGKILTQPSIPASTDVPLSTGGRQTARTKPRGVPAPVTFRGRTGSRGRRRARGTKVTLPPEDSGNSEEVIRDRCKPGVASGYPPGVLLFDEVNLPNTLAIARKEEATVRWLVAKKLEPTRPIPIRAVRQSKPSRNVW